MNTEVVNVVVFLSGAGIQGQKVILVAKPAVMEKGKNLPIVTTLPRARHST